MAAPRGGKGPNDRGRGSRSGSPSFRGGSGGRGRGNGGFGQHNTDRASSPSWTPRGGAQRGAFQNGSRGRGGYRRTSFTSNPSAANSTPFAQDEYQKRLQHIKNARPSIREQFIRKGLMNPEGQMKLSDSVKLIGICTDMCPEYERVRRIVENDVKPPECTAETEHLPRAERIPDETRMVKAYARSAAGMDVELVSEIRSPATCLKTVEYLFHRLDEDEFDYLQSWIWDRARAVRKDLRTQRIEKRSDIRIFLTCLEQTARFHLLSMHQMARSEKEDYSHQQDLEQLNQTLMSLRERYLDNRRASIPSDNEAEITAYRFILAPQYAGNQLENEMHALPSDLRHNNRVKTAIQIFQLLKSVLITRSTSFVQCQANWKKLWDLIRSPQVSYLMACAAEVSFNRVRHVVLDSLWRSYRKGNSSKLVVVDEWTTEKLKAVLGLDTDREAVKLCEDFGFQFSVNPAGKTFLDITQMGYAQTVLSAPDVSRGVKPQTFSARLVEIKRHGRAPSAIIQGMPVQQAQQKGLLGNTDWASEDSGMEDETSLFVPESSNSNNVFKNQPTAPPTASLNPFANPFQPTAGAPVSALHPFLKGTSQAQPVQSTSSTVASNPFLKGVSQAQPPQTIEPSTFTNPSGLFDASKNQVNFADSTTSPASDNPFFKTAGTAAPTQPNPFTKFSSTAPPPEQSPAAIPPTTTPPHDPTPSTNFLPQPAFSFAPSAAPSVSTLDPEEEEKRKEEHILQEKLKKEQQEAEAKRRAQEALQAKLQSEAQERQRQAGLRAEEERRRQQRLEEERRVKELQEQQRREFQRREEEDRLRKIQEREAAWQALTNDIMFDREQGLLMQFIENATERLAEEVRQTLERETWQAAWAKGLRLRRLSLSRKYLVRWYGIVQKRKRDQKTRERRRRLKEQRARSAQGEDQQPVEQPVAQPVMPPPKVDAASRTLIIKTSARRVKRTKERHEACSERTNHEDTSSSSNESLHTANIRQGAQSTTNNTSNGDYSQAYYEALRKRSNAPIDRTETDWFRLRAMGIDPTKHRKRSFDSNSEEEERPQIDSKRPKLSPPPVDTHTTPATALSTFESQRARFHALQESFRKSTSSLPLNGNSLRSTNGHSSTDLVIAKVRNQIGSSPSSGHLAAPHMSRTPSSEVQHDWGRSVPNLGFSASKSSHNALAKSTNAIGSEDRPSYWYRTSRFVPRHLYGKGADAARAYQAQYSRRTSNPGDQRLKFESQSQSPGSVLEQRRQTIEHPFGSRNMTEDNVAGSQYEFEEDEHEEGAMEDATMLDDGDGQYQDDEEDDEEDNEEEEEEEEQDGDNEQSVTGRPYYAQQYEDDEDHEDYDEYTEEEEEEEEDEEEQYAQPQAHQQLFAPSSSFGGSASQQLKQAGNTEDDAIELSD